MAEHCCSTEESTGHKTRKGGQVPGSPGSPDNNADQKSPDHPSHHNHHHSSKSKWGMFLPALITFAMLLVALVIDHFYPLPWFEGWIRIAWYVVAYLPVGLPVLQKALESIRNSNFFSEFFLMGIATLGAFAIGEYPEAVAVMLFYTVGEIFQSLAVTRAKGNIKALLDQRPDQVTVIRDQKAITIPAEEAGPGDTIQLKPGEKLALDGNLLSQNASFNTAALTGESKPDTRYRGETVLAGMINLNTVSQIRVTSAFADSKLSKILAMVQDAAARKAPTELFIRKFARVYTPIVVFLAIGITLLPVLFVDPYVFSDWLYRALVFLVISCPCALVISIPLGYFGGIGAGSRNGILVKGSNFLDVLARIDTVVMDKTGTLTEGVFEVQDVVISPDLDQEDVLKMVHVLESHSTHPVATAIGRYVGEVEENYTVENVREMPGYGLEGTINGRHLVVGNARWLDQLDIGYDPAITAIVDTVIVIALDHRFAGYLTISDRIKTDAKSTIDQLHRLNIRTVMLSGDKTTVAEHVARQLGMDDVHGDLLPEDKVARMKEIKAGTKQVAFVGDGVNDAPVLALSDVGIAMGGLGSDAAIETADVVIQDDRPSKIPVAIHIGRQTKKIVWQNIALAFGVKALVLILGAWGLASMWEAVFADVGVALLAILNAVRIQRMSFG